jgi:hypothetical protein
MIHGRSPFCVLGSRFVFRFNAAALRTVEADLQVRPATRRVVASRWSPQNLNHDGHDGLEGHEIVQDRVVVFVNVVFSC